MYTYDIKKISNGEIKEINKNFTFDYDKYLRNRELYFFKEDGSEIPVVFNPSLFNNILLEQVQQGLTEYMSFENNVLVIHFRDGNTINKYAYDFSLPKIVDKTTGFGLSKNYSEVQNEVYEASIYRIISLYNENPNKAVSSSVKYIRMIMDIIDGDRLPEISNESELLRIFEVYNANKASLLQLLLENVVFYDENGSVLDYGPRLKSRLLNSIKYDVINQMDIAIMMFAVTNNAYDLYQQYMSNLFIARREIEYQYVDENGNPIEPVQETEGGTIFSVAREIVRGKAKDVKESIKTLTKKVVNQIPNNKGKKE